jgi:hypothetical protein
MPSKEAPGRANRPIRALPDPSRNEPSCFDADVAVRGAVLSAAFRTRPIELAVTRVHRLRLGASARQWGLGRERR